MLLDSNIIIYAALPEYGVLRNYLNSYKKILNVSIISKLEVLGYHKLRIKEKIIFERFFNSINTFQISSELIDIALDLRQKRKMSIGDSIIGATAIYQSEELLTNNEDDFIGINNIKVVSLKSIQEY